jgi:hypothetical protein
LISAVLSAIGPGPISVTALMSVLIVALATETGTHPVKLLPFGALGAFAGGLSPISPSGIVANSVATESGIAGLAAGIFLAFRKKSLILVAAASCAAVFLAEQLLAFLH